MTQVLAEWIAAERSLWSRAHPGSPAPVVRCDLDGGAGRGATSTPTRGEPGAWRSRLSWTAVYLFLDREAHPLYVGVTVTPDQRLDEHARSPFWAEAAAVAVTWRSSRSSALTRETELIDALSPPYNRARRAEPETRRNHELVLMADGQTRRHPQEDVLTGETDLAQAATGECWDCASPMTLAAALEGRAPVRFDPFRSSLACACRKTRRRAGAATSPSRAGR